MEAHKVYMFINELSDAIEWIEYTLHEFMEDKNWEEKLAHWTGELLCEGTSVSWKIELKKLHELQQR